MSVCSVRWRMPAGKRGERERAHALWGRVLRIDPEDLRAWGLFHFPTQRWQPLPPFNSPPDVTMRQELARLADALGSGAGARELLARGSRLRVVTLWALTLPSAEIQRATLAALASGEDEDTRRALRDILVMPDVLPQVRQLALGRLAMLGRKAPTPCSWMAVLPWQAAKKPRRPSAACGSYFYACCCWKRKAMARAGRSLNCCRRVAAHDA